MSITESSELETYLSKNREQLISFITQKTGDPDLAEDLLQESLLKAFRASSELRDRDKLISWFYRIIRNAITDVYRKQGREDRFLKEYAAELGKELIPEEEKRLCRCFVNLIPTLKEDYAVIINSLELGDENPDKVAEQLNINRNNLKVKRHRARQQLKERLEQTCRTCAKHGCVNCTCSG